MLNQVTAYLSHAQITDVSHNDSDISLQLGAHKLWVSTPWRIEKERTILMGNDNLLEYLSHDDYKDDYEEALDFIKENLIGSTIVEVAYSDFSELILKLSNGHNFRSFQSYGDDAENFQLYIEKKRLLVYLDRVDVENLHKFYED